MRTLSVPEQPGLQWTPALDFITPGKILKIEVAAGATWTPEGFIAPCGADGDSSGAFHPGTLQRDNLMVPNAPIGALIGRIGGKHCRSSGRCEPQYAAVLSRTILRVADPRHDEGQFVIGSQ